MSKRRRFNRSERAALFLAADGKCSLCGRALEPGWHADHMTPHVAGGPTDVINGQALCPDCNLRKGPYTMKLRGWQQQAIDKFHAHEGPDFLVSATPGSGKTPLALELARRLIETGVVRRAAVIVPSDSLRQQWADAASKFGLALMPVSDETDYDKAGYVGYVATFQQLATSGAALARRATQTPTLGIIDEIHHAADSRAWGDALLHAMEHSTKRLGLTGTPWRRDNNPIPFVAYDENGTVIVDSRYEYGQAVQDGVCRPIEFHAYDGEARWRDCGEPRDATLGADLPDDDIPAVLDAVLHPDHAYIPVLLRRAASDLDELRTEVPDAGGLVVAHERWHAERYAVLLEQITGEEPTIAHGDVPEARANIEAYRHARSRWLVAVRMVSEGVDIPRLAVGVYATKIRTPLNFRQVVGRFVRARPDEEFNARLFIPAVPTLMNHAREIEEELRHQLEVERERDAYEATDGQVELPLREPLGASEAIFDQVIYKGEEIGVEEHAHAEELCRTYDFPLNKAVNLVRVLRDHGGVSTPRPNEVPITEPPQHRREKLLRSDIDTLVGKISYRTDIEKREINTRLLKAGFPPRKKASIDELEQMRSQLTEWLDKLS